MQEWWTYRLSDFLLFSPDTYHRLVGSYNREIWPAQIVGLAMGLGIIMLARREDQRSGRAIAAILAAALLWVSVAFEWRQFATINWFARYVAVGLAVEAALLIWIGVSGGRIVLAGAGRGRRTAGYGLIVLAVLGYPLLDLALGRGLSGVGVFGSMRDPTVVATLGVLLLANGRARWALLPIPILSCLLSAAMFLAMQAVS